MSNISAKIDRILQEGYNFRFGDYISKGFELVNKNLGGFVGYAVTYLLISTVISFVPILGQIAGLVIGPALMAGFYHVAHRVDLGEMPAFNEFFKGFDKLGNLFLTSFLTALIIIGSAIPGIILLFTTGFSMTDIILGGSEDVNSTMIIVSVLLMLIPAMYLGVSYAFAPMFVWFYNLQPWNAMETSRKVVGKNWLSMFGFSLVVGLIAALGILLIGVGLLYTLPACMCAVYAAFADITGLLEADETEGSDVIDHFVPQS